jgi:hypothetical protein
MILPKLHLVGSIYNIGDLIIIPFNNNIQTKSEYHCIKFRKYSDSSQSNSANAARTYDTRVIKMGRDSYKPNLY